MMSLTRRDKIQTLFAALGKDSNLHLVGGCVRDHLLGNTPHDFDLCTVLHPDQVEDRLNRNGIKFVVTGIRRGTITAVIDGEPFEITTFRNPANEKEFVQDIEMDLAARDFTINAIAINISTEQIIDPFGGHQDLNNSLLRCVGEPERRFTEDPHRILRMARFGWGAQRMVCPDTEKAAEKLSNLIVNIAPERIHDELIKIVCTEFPDRALAGLQLVGALKVFLPELEACVGMHQNRHHRFDVFTHITETVKNIRQDKILRLAALFHDIGKATTISSGENGDNHFYGHEKESVILTKNIMERLRFSNDETEQVIQLVGKHQFDLGCGFPAIRRLLHAIGEEGIFKLIELKRADAAAGHVDPKTSDIDGFVWMVEEQIENSKKKPFIELAINGNDILALGVPEGKEVGRLLSIVRESVIENPENNNRESLLELVRKEL